MLHCLGCAFGIDICVLIHGQPDPAFVGASCCGLEDAESLCINRLAVNMSSHMPVIFFCEHDVMNVKPWNHVKPCQAMIVRFLITPDLLNFEVRHVYP